MAAIKGKPRRNGGELYGHLHDSHWFWAGDEGDRKLDRIFIGAISLWPRDCHGRQAKMVCPGNRARTGLTLNADVLL